MILLYLIFRHDLSFETSIKIKNVIGKIILAKTSSTSKFNSVDGILDINSLYIIVAIIIAKITAPDTNHNKRKGIPLNLSPILS